MKLLPLLLIFSFPALAQVTEANIPFEEKKEIVEVVEVIKKKLTQDHRESSTGTVMFSYRPISTWMPSKKSLSYTHIFSKDWSLEAGYAWASLSFPVFGIDIGEISEKWYTLQVLKYFGNSFHLIFGGYKSEMRVRVGNDILNRMGNKNMDVLSVQNMGTTMGVGNRWQFENGFSWGIDWIRLNIPLFAKQTDDEILTNIDDESDRENIKKITRRFENFPTLVLLGFNLGYTF